MNMNMQNYFLIGVLIVALAAGVLWGRTLLASSDSVDTGWSEVDKQTLFVPIEPERESSLLEDWRWKVGEDAKIFRVTVFGDVFTQAPDGSISFLATDTGEHFVLAENPKQWAERLAPVLFNWDLLQELQSLDIQLPEGAVYDWQKPPLLGGEETVDNIQWVPVYVRLAAAGQLAEQLEKGTSAEQQQGDAMENDDGLYDVVINSEEQYSVWPVGREIPDGWKREGKSGTKNECVDYISEVWTDMRPLSLRAKDEKE